MRAGLPWQLLDPQVSPSSDEAMVVLIAAAALQAASPTTVTFQASDGVTVYGDLYLADADRGGTPTLLLLHQSASNATEYAPIVHRFTDLGYHALAVDARGGGSEALGGTNRTVARLEQRGGGAEAYHDFKAALAWLRAEGFTGPVAIVGSSYSAGRMFQLLAESPRGVVAAAAFSPGAAFATRYADGVPSWAEQTTIPIFMTWAPDELDDERRERFERVASQDRTLFEQRAGVHGASTLRADRNPEGSEDNLSALIAVLRRHLGS